MMLLESRESSLTKMKTVKKTTVIVKQEPVVVKKTYKAVKGDEVDEML